MDSYRLGDGSIFRYYETVERGNACQVVLYGPYCEYGFVYFGGQYIDVLAYEATGDRVFDSVPSLRYRNTDCNINVMSMDGSPSFDFGDRGSFIQEVSAWLDDQGI